MFFYGHLKMRSVKYMNSNYIKIKHVNQLCTYVTFAFKQKFTSKMIVLSQRIYLISRSSIKIRTPKCLNLLRNHWTNFSHMQQPWILMITITLPMVLASFYYFLTRRNSILHFKPMPNRNQNR